MQICKTLVLPFENTLIYVCAEIAEAINKTNKCMPAHKNQQTVNELHSHDCKLVPPCHTLINLSVDNRNM